ncbi:uncharacterized protein LOC105687266 isoform X1 [Athalia rosae]|uniref:uncharacterized protein LOC105687266 isoform X1 n=2 Tax=Athalia rosae TaxID=37344 RepID=UPI002033825C|nr:uncharacterized protein LOC105687266 isoform X1 [Athalia rosae]
MKRSARMIALFVKLYLIPHCFGYDAGLTLKETGEKEYLLLKAKSTLPHHGKCWHNVLRGIKASCDKLNDREHSLLALQLTNCFLEDSGHATYDCILTKEENDRRECIGEMSDRAFGVYSTFFTQAMNICYFLNQEIWQSETDHTIKQLYHASSRMNQQLLEASEMQNVMLESQKQGLKLQNELLDHGQQLGSVIKSSAETVTTMVADFKENASEQRELLHQIFSNVHVFQNWIVSEVSWFQSIVFYTVSCILCGLFTSSKRTAEARITMFITLSLNVVVERMLVQYYNKGNSDDVKIELSYITWMFRKISLTICVLTLLFTSCLYRDEQLENSKALQRIECQLGALYEMKKPTIRYSRRLALRRQQECEVTEEAKVERMTRSRRRLKDISLNS